MSATAIAVAVSIEILEVSNTRLVGEMVLVGLTIVMGESALRHAAVQSTERRAVQQFFMSFVFQIA
jgi:hypothetical protein